MAKKRNTTRHSSVHRAWKARSVLVTRHQATRSYSDLHEHLAALKKQGLLLTIDRPVDKDAELHPLVRWQYVGGIEEHERKAFLFTNVVDGRGRKYQFPVVVGAYAGNRAIYCIGMRAKPEQVRLRSRAVVCHAPGRRRPRTSTPTAWPTPPPTH